MTAEVDAHEVPGAPDARVPAACQAELGWGIATLFRSFGQAAAAALEGLPGGARGHLVLATIARGRPASQLALANELGVDRTVMTYLLDELERAGLLERRPDPADRRARQVIITKAGSQAADDYRVRLDAVEQHLLAPLTAQEAAAFRTYVERVARAAVSATGGPAVADPCVGDDC